MATRKTLFDQCFDAHLHRQDPDTLADDREALQMITAYLEPLVAQYLAAEKMDAFYRTAELNLWDQAEALFTRFGQAIGLKQKGTFAQHVAVDGGVCRVWMNGTEVHKTTNTLLSSNLTLYKLSDSHCLAKRYY